MKIKPTLRMLIMALLIVGTGPASLAIAQTPPDSHLRLLSSDGQAIVLELIVDGFQTETVAYESHIYHRLIIPDMVQTDTPGEPQIPTRGTLVGLPTAEGVSVQILDANYETLRGYQLLPAPAVKVTKDILDDLLPGDVQQTFSLDQDLHATDAFYPGKLVEINHTGIIRDQAVAQVQFYPVQYSPVTGEIHLYRRILARITWAMPSSTAATETRSASPAYEKLLQSTLLNYDTLERPPVAEPTPPIGTTDNDIGAASITPTLKIGVTRDGIYQLTPADLTGAGFDLGGTDLNTIKISNRGAEIPIYVHDANSNNTFDGNDYILFYGTAITDMYTARNVYWLTAGGSNGLRMSTKDGTPGSAPLAEHFPATLHAEEDTYYWQTMPNGEGQDHWFWGGRLLAEFFPSRVYTLTLNHISTTASTATVRVRFKGGTDNPYVNPDHYTRISLNDVEIGGLHQWDGFSIYDQEATVPHSELNEGSNTVKVELVGTSYQQLLVNWIEINYWDTYVAENDHLLFGAPAAGTFQFEVTGFSTDDVQTFDVTDPMDVAIISNTTVVTAGGSYKLQFEDNAQAETRYLAQTATQHKSPASIELDQSSSWKSTDQGADYIIITHRDFYTSAQRLANHHSAPGFRVATVEVEDVYDEFNYGIFNPQAIRDFLSYAYYNWVSPAPTYVLLVGDASQDYKDNLNTGTVNYVPSQIIETDLSGETSSDNWFVAVDGPEDILPDMFIGRLTAQTASKADDMVDKIIHYEQNPPDTSWNKNVLLVADDDEPYFEIISEELADRLPYHYTVNKVYAGDYPPGDPTTDITNHINSGSLLVNYAGHGSVDRWGQWSGGRIFSRSPDVTSLNNTNKLPVVTVANCLNGFFAGSKTQVSMAEEFLRLKDEGAVAVWAATSLGYASGHRVLMREFYEAIFQDDSYALGAATTAAKISTYGLNNFWGELVQTFVLLGDPAMQLGLPTNYPYVKSTMPANGASNVPLDQDIQIVFSKPMSPTTVVLGGPGSVGLVLTPTWGVDSDYTLLSFDHADFDESQTLTFSIEGQDKLGNSLGVGPIPSTWSFTTVVLRPTDVAIIGPTIGITQTSYTFVADLSPNTVAQPITYAWQATGQTPVTHPSDKLVDTVNFQWNVTGTQAITVTATNAYGIITDTHAITISDFLPGANTVYLPIVIKND